MGSCTGEDEYGELCGNPVPPGPGMLVVVGDVARRPQLCRTCADRMLAWNDQFLRRAPRTAWPAHAPVIAYDGSAWPAQLARIVLELCGASVNKVGALGPVAVREFRRLTMERPDLWTLVIARVKTAARLDPHIAALIREEAERDGR